MKITFVAIWASLVFLLPQSGLFAQSTLPAFSDEQLYRFTEQYNTLMREKENSASIYGKQFDLGRIGRKGRLSITRDDGADDYSRPDPLSPNKGARFRLKVPF